MEGPYEINSGIEIDNFSQDAIAIGVPAEGSALESFPKLM
jgi:hypothetical protein